MTSQRYLRQADIDLLGNTVKLTAPGAVAIAGKPRAIGTGGSPRSRAAAARAIRIVGGVSIANLMIFCAPARGTRERAPVARCDVGTVQSLGPPVNSPAFDGSPTVSADETELFFTSERNGHRDLFVSTRPSKQAAWSEPVNLGPPVDDPNAGDFSLRLSVDGKSLYFASNRNGGFGKADMYVATRASRQHPWGPAVNLGPLLNTEAFEAFPTPNADGTMLFFNRSAAFDSDDSDIWITTRAKPGDPWSMPRRAPSGINSEGAEFSPSISVDGTTLYFASGRSGAIEVWVSTRPYRSQEWGPPQRLGVDVNRPRAMTLAPFISGDQRSLYFMAARPDAAALEVCTSATCFGRVDLYVGRVNCR
jgi:Tol biopolymer transport system component